MPQIFDNAVVTNDGKALLSKETAGECQIEITRMTIGNGIYTSDEKTTDSLEKMKSLKSEKQSVQLSSLKRQDNTAVLVTGIFTNDNIDVSYHINEIGLYAQEKGNKSSEILYSIAVVSADQGEVMPASEGKNPVRIIQDWVITVSNSADVTIQTLPDGAFAMLYDVGIVDELQTENKILVGAVNEVLRKMIDADAILSDSKANGQGITFTVEDGKPYMTYEYDIEEE